MVRQFVFIVLFSIGWLPSQAISADKEVYQFGVFAYKGEQKTRDEFEPIIKAVNHSLERELLEMQVLSQADIYKGLENNTLDFV
ncbi:MAG: hypothetical protein RI556_12825, partial [Hydrogenovibrio sp.]|uniref:hypothetical protein n=1 Tax=Hydrogenovibrio sp. TaxID=2065821 RepID=UPI00286FDDE9